MLSSGDKMQQIICKTLRNALHFTRFTFEPLYIISQWKQKIVAAFRGMHVSPAKHSYASVTDGQTDDGQSDPYVLLCFAGDTKSTSSLKYLIFITGSPHRRATRSTPQKSDSLSSSRASGPGASSANSPASSLDSTSTEPLGRQSPSMLSGRSPSKSLEWSPRRLSSRTPGQTPLSTTLSSESLPRNTSSPMRNSRSGSPWKNQSIGSAQKSILTPSRVLRNETPKTAERIQRYTSSPSKTPKTVLTPSKVLRNETPKTPPRRTLVDRTTLTPSRVLRSGSPRKTPQRTPSGGKGNYSSNTPSSRRKSQISASASEGNVADLEVDEPSLKGSNVNITYFGFDVSDREVDINTNSNAEATNGSEVSGSRSAQEEGGEDIGPTEARDVDVSEARNFQQAADYRREMLIDKEDSQRKTYTGKRIIYG